MKRRLPREEYKRILPGLQTRLYNLEKACWDHSISSVVIFEGWDGSGKGAAVATLTQRLDPRGFRLYPILAPNASESQFPWLHRFWLKVPNRGEMVIFDGSWYRRVLDERVGGLSEREWREAYRDIAEFERMLADDGTAILKFFLHISKREQKRRLRKLEDDPMESWRVTAADWARHARYDEYTIAIEDMLELTEAEFSPWVIVEASSRWYARKRIFETLIASLEKRLGSQAPPKTAEESSSDADLRAAMDVFEEDEPEEES